jgi:hypothetical protein
MVKRKSRLQTPYLKSDRRGGETHSEYECEGRGFEYLLRHQMNGPNPSNESKKSLAELSFKLNLQLVLHHEINLERLVSNGYKVAL